MTRHWKRCVFGMVMLVSGPAPAAPPAPAPAAPAPHIKATVVDPEGKSVAGASVYLVSQPGDVEKVDAPACKTDKDGKIDIEFTPAPARVKNPIALVLVDAPPWAICGKYCRPDGPETIQLKPPTELWLPLIDEVGKPAANVEVRVARVTAPGEFFNSFDPVKALGLVAKSDANGVVKIGRLPQSAKAMLNVEDERFARLTFEQSVALDSQEKTSAAPLKLTAAATVRGKLTYPDGKPAAGVDVAAQGLHPNNGWAKSTSDEKGDYILKQLGAGAYNIALSLEGQTREDWTAVAQEKLELAAGEQKTGIDFHLIKGSLISGHVSAADNGAGVAEIPIGVYGPAHPRSGAWVQTTSTDKEGKYTLRVPPGKQHVYIQTAEAPEGFELPRAVVIQDVEVADGQTLTLDFKLPRAAAPVVLKGRVLDADDKPVAGADVLVEPLTNESSLFGFGGSMPGTHADEQGRFEVKLVAKRRAARLRARQGDLATPQSLVVKGDETEEIVLRVKSNALASVSGTAVDAHGKVLSAAAVWLTIMTGSYGTGTETARTDSKGQFKIDSLWADGVYSIDVKSPGLGIRKTGKLNLRPGETTDVGFMILRDIDSFVAGRVLDTEGKAVANVKVSTNGGKELDPQQGKTDAKGNFRLPAVSGDEMDVYATFPDGRIGHQRAKAGEEQIELRQARGRVPLRG